MQRFSAGGLRLDSVGFGGLGVGWIGLLLAVAFIAKAGRFLFPLAFYLFDVVMLTINLSTYFQNAANASRGESAISQLGQAGAYNRPLSSTT